MWLALTIVLVCAMVAKPELRTLAPLVDAVGLDVLLLLFGVQLLFAWRWMFSSVLAPSLHACGRTMRLLDRWSARMPTTAAVRRVASALLLRFGSTGVASWLVMHWLLAALPGE